MKKTSIVLLIFFFTFVFTVYAYSSSDFLWAYSTWFSSSAINAARDATPVIKMSDEQEAIYRLGFAAGYDTAREFESTTQLFDEGNGLEDAAVRVVVSDDSFQGERQSFIANTETNKFHIPGCYAEKKILPEHRKEIIGTFEEVRQMGYSPCGICFKNSD